MKNIDNVSKMIKNFESINLIRQIKKYLIEELKLSINSHNIYLCTYCFL